MAKTITLHNVEKLVFENNELRKKIPSKKHLFHTWVISRQSPDLKAMGQKSLLEFLNTTTEEDVRLLSDHFGETVVVEKISTNVVEHYNCLIDEAEKVLNAETIIKEAFFVYREENQIYLSMWR